MAEITTIMEGTATVPYWQLICVKKPYCMVPDIRLLYMAQ